MHGFGSGSAFLVNAEVDSMGGVVDGGVGIGIKTSPHRASIEKAQAELRQEYDFREEKRRELEFLEKGGNPLDFKVGIAASVSVQSTSLTDHHAEHFVTSEAKGSFALTASPHGDSVESSGRPGAHTVCEPNTADNFDGENELLEGERNPEHPSKRNKVAPPEQSSQMDATQNAKESEDSAIVRPYARRNRSRPNRDGARSSSTDVVQSSGGHGSSLPIRGGSRNAKGSVYETNSQKDSVVPSVSNPKSNIPNGDIVSQIETSNIQSKVESGSVQALEVITNQSEDRLPADKLDVIESSTLSASQHGQPSEVDPQITLVDIPSGEDLVGGKGQEASGDPDYPPCLSTLKSENGAVPARENGFNDSKKDEGQNGSAAIETMGLDLESSCAKNNVLNNDSDLCIKHGKNDSNGTLNKQMSELEGTQNLMADEMKNEENEMKAIDSCAATNDGSNSVCENQPGCDSTVKIVEEIQRSSDFPKEVKCPNNGAEQDDHAAAESDKKLDNMLGDDNNSNRENTDGPLTSVGLAVNELTGSTEKNSSVAPDPQSSYGQLTILDKAHEDSILAEARIIEAKRKRIAELSVATVPSESRKKSHWDFVLEEMAWMANDFAQERLWKITAAAQICHRVAFTSQQRFEEKNKQWKLKKVAYTLAKAVMQFWHLAEALVNNNGESLGLKIYKDDSRRFDGAKSFDDKFVEEDENTCKELKNPPKNLPHAIQGYAVRFLKCNNSSVPSLEAEAPTTPDQIADSGIVEVSWDDQLTEESLFYAVPSGAMETYRMSIESHLAQCEKTGSSMQEEVDTSTYDAAAEFGYHENAFDEEEGETSTYYLPRGFDGSKSTKHDQKKRKSSMKSFSGRSYEVGADLAYSMIGSQPNLMGKRPSDNLNVGFPTKRVRTASRQRIISPFSAGITGGLQTPARTDASSGDTSSFQDDQSTLHGGTHMQKSVEVESVGDFEKQLPYDCTDTSTKPKKKNKAKHLGSAYEQGWQLDSTTHNEQRESFKKRLESHHFDSNGTTGLYGQHTAKKPKITKHSLDTNFNKFAPMAGSIPSPAASQMSNMPNTNRIMRLIREKGRKPKSVKVLTGQPGSGSPWSVFEDQALVVLVHDMGPNWELISDAINSTLQFKCIYRKPKECKERHKILMDKGAGDGADSAEDSGSSQSYPSTLPGIPKGSARQLFQRLQGPMEEDMLKSHFEKIIMIGKRQLFRRSQNDHQEPKPITAVHDSHFIALSKVCPNNLNGGVLTPLDLCDVAASNPDVISTGYQGSHASGLAMPNHGAAASVLPSSGANSSLQGSSGMLLGNNSSSPSGPLGASARDGRCNVPRSSLPVDEQQRMQHYNHMLSGRNLQQSNLPVSGADRRMLPVGNGMGMMPGMNRNIPMVRPGFQGMPSSPVLNSGSMHSSSMVGMPSPVNVHSGTVSAQGNSMMRPREALHMMRPGYNPEHQRQMMVPELHMQVTQGNSQAIPAFNALGSTFANQTSHAPVPAYPGHPQQQHQLSPQQSHVLNNPHHPHLQGPNHGSQQQAYTIRMSKDRHIQQQQRLSHQSQQQQQQQQQPQQHQQQQFAASSAMTPHIQPQAQLPVATSIQSSSQIQPQPSSQPVSVPLLTPSPMTPMSMQQQKHNLPLHGLSRNPQAGASGLTNQMGKQRQRQPQQQQQQQQNFQQSGRHHPQQRQHPQSTQQSKLMKGMGRGNMMAHQNVPIDHSHLNGLSVPPGNQVAEKGEQLMHLMQGQGLYSGTGLAPIQPTKPLVPQSSNHLQPQQKVYSGSAPPSSKQPQQTPSHSDNSGQGIVPSVSSGHALSASNPAVSGGIMPSSHQHLQSKSQPHQKLLNQAQPTVQRMLQQNCQVNCDLPTKSHIDQGCTDQQPVNTVSRMSTGTTTAMPPLCNDSANVGPSVSSAAAPQWKPSESLYDSGMLNPTSQVSSIGTPPLADSSGNDPVPPVGQGLVQRQSSGGLPQHGHNVGALWQQQSQLQQSTASAAPPPSQKLFQPSAAPPPSKKLFQPQEQPFHQEQSIQQLPPQQQSQQQAQNLQPMQTSLYIRPTPSELE